MLDTIMNIGIGVIVFILLLILGFIFTAMSYFTGLRKGRGEDHHKAIRDLESQIVELQEKEGLLIQKDMLLSEIEKLKAEQQECVYNLSADIDGLVERQKGEIYKRAYNDAISTESLQLKVREVEALEKIASSKTG